MGRMYTVADLEERGFGRPKKIIPYRPLKSPLLPEVSLSSRAYLRGGVDWKKKIRAEANNHKLTEWCK